MASAPTVPLVSVDEYLNSSYEYDMEYVDGVLIEGSMPTAFHSLLQALLIAYFRPLEKEFRIKAMPGFRTEIIYRARYRIPDLLLVTVPFPFGKVLTHIPDVVIEILLPEDKHRETMARFRDYSNRGVSYIIHMDPEEYVAHCYQAGSLIQTAFRILELPDGRSVPFSSTAL